jgi:hypothetical protein
MSERGSLPSISEADYGAIEAAVLETARGRWFLREFARRNRTADTLVLLDAMSRLEQAVAAERSAQDLDRLRFDLVEMAKAIALTKTEIAALHPADQPYSHLVVASEALDGITRTTERATSDILDAAEQIQEAAWTLREEGANAPLCDKLDRRATEIYTACSFQDVTAQRTSRIIHTLRYLEGRINAMIDIWGGTPGEAAGPIPIVKPDGENLTQTDVDCVIINADPVKEADADAARRFALSSPLALDGDGLADDDLAFVETPLPPATVVGEPSEIPAEEPMPIRTEAFADIDALDARDKLCRFV